MSNCEVVLFYYIQVTLLYWSVWLNSLFAIRLEVWLFCLFQNHPFADIPRLLGCTGEKVYSWRGLGAKETRYGICVFLYPHKQRSHLVRPYVCLFVSLIYFMYMYVVICNSLLWTILKPSALSTINKLINNLVSLPSSQLIHTSEIMNLNKLVLIRTCIPSHTYLRS